MSVLFRCRSKSTQVGGNRYMGMTSLCLVGGLGEILLGAGCNVRDISRQEDLGRGIVQGTLGARPVGDVRLPIPVHTSSVKGQVTVVEGGAYVLQEANGIERRVAHDENTRIDRPAHVGDRIEVFMDDNGRAVFIRNIDQEERLQ